MNHVKILGRYLWAFEKRMIAYTKTACVIFQSNLEYLTSLWHIPKICTEETKYQVRVDSTSSEAFTVETGLKQGNALSPLRFNLALENPVKMMQSEASGVITNDYRVQILGFADDLHIHGEWLESILGLTTALERAAEKEGLRLNAEKTKITEILDGEPYQDKLDSIGFEKVEELVVFRCAAQYKE